MSNYVLTSRVYRKASPFSGAGFTSVGRRAEDSCVAVQVAVLRLQANNHGHLRGVHMKDVHRLRTCNMATRLTHFEGLYELIQY